MNNDFDNDIAFGQKNYPFDNQDDDNQNPEKVENENGQQDDLPELEDYEQIDGRLQEIQHKIENEEMTLDESLDLYEEAVALGMKATKTINQNVGAHLQKEDDELEEEDNEAGSEDNDVSGSEDNDVSGDEHQQPKTDPQPGSNNVDGQNN